MNKKSSRQKKKKGRKSKFILRDTNHENSSNVFKIEQDLPLQNKFSFKSKPLKQVLCWNKREGQSWHPTGVYPRCPTSILGCCWLEALPSPVHGRCSAVDSDPSHSGNTSTSPKQFCPNWIPSENLQCWGVVLKPTADAIKMVILDTLDLFFLSNLSLSSIHRHYLELF